MCSKVGVVLHYCCGMPSSYIPLPFPLVRSGRHNIFFLCGLIVLYATIYEIVKLLPISNGIEQIPKNDQICMILNAVYIRFCDQAPSQGSRSLDPMVVAKLTGFPLGRAQPGGR